MSDITEIHVARLGRDVPTAEVRIDDALIALSSLMTSVVTARRDATGVPPVKGQATIQRLAKAQLSLIDASADVLRVHGDLVGIGRETGGYDLHECPQLSESPAAQLGSTTRGV